MWREAFVFFFVLHVLEPCSEGDIRVTVLQGRRRRFGEVSPSHFGAELGLTRPEVTLRKPIFLATPRLLKGFRSFSLSPYCLNQEEL